MAEIWVRKRTQTNRTLGRLSGKERWKIGKRTQTNPRNEPKIPFGFNEIFDGQFSALTRGVTVCADYLRFLFGSGLLLRPVSSTCYFKPRRGDLSQPSHSCRLRHPETMKKGSNAQDGAEVRRARLGAEPRWGLGRPSLVLRARSPVWPGRRHEPETEGAQATSQSRLLV
jgi:hypothetical protein